ncbi:unnamed protein product [Caenorhabditis sp. 36 PRJEB53466]|nr:unnamed protein product [Caenorhabditis sp. 36 PRJEB53466]
MAGNETSVVLLDGRAELDTFILIWTCFQFLYGIQFSITTLIYITISFGYKSIVLNSFFYGLAVADLSVNILCWWNTWFSTRMESIPFLIPSLKFIEALRPGSLTFFKNLNTFFFHLQVCSALSMFVYRFGRLACPLHFAYYRKLYFILYFLCSCAYSGLLSFSYYGETVQVYLNNETLTKVTDMEDSKKSLWFTCISSGVYMFLFLALGLAPTRFKLDEATDRLSIKLREREKVLRFILGPLIYVYCSVYTGIVLCSVLNLIHLYHPFLPVWILQHNNLFLATVSDLVNC